MDYSFNKENFDKLMKQFVLLDLNEQRQQIIDDLKYIIAIQSKLCEINNSNFDILYNKEISDLKQEQVSEKDFLEAVYAYLYILKSGNYNFVNSTINKLASIYSQN